MRRNDRMLTERYAVSVTQTTMNGVYEALSLSKEHHRSIYAPGAQSVMNDSPAKDDGLALILSLTNDRQCIGGCFGEPAKYKMGK